MAMEALLKLQLRGSASTDAVEVEHVVVGIRSPSSPVAPEIDCSVADFDVLRGDWCS